MYLNNDFTKKPLEEIKQELMFCGLSKESISELARHLSYPTSQQYVLEKNYLSSANTALSFLLAVVAAYLLMLVLSSSNPTAIFGNNVSVCHYSFFGHYSSIPKQTSPRGFQMLLAWVKVWRKFNY